MTTKTGVRNLRKSEHLTNEWLKWLLENAMSEVDSLLYEHFARHNEDDSAFCSICTAMAGTIREEAITDS